jgi:5'-nucleotidase / UDP-sugar diphosphatase
MKNLTKIIYLFFFTLSLTSSCIEHSYGENQPDREVTKKAVFIHTTDSHGKYFPFWMEPNMFDREMGLGSSNPHCWDINKNNFCDGAWISGIGDDGRGRYKTWVGGKYEYLTETQFEEGDYLSEDLNHDGVCDIFDCQRCWDINRNNKCDREEDKTGDGGCGEKDCLLQIDNPVVFQCWDTNGNGKCDKEEDLNNDSVCNFKDCILVWDRNHNRDCDFPYDTVNNTWFDEDRNPILEKNYDAPDEYQAALSYAIENSEDINRDGVCDYKDYRPGLVNSGGVARVKSVIDKIREQHKEIPVLYLDSGDAFQGAPQYNLYKGELEMLALQFMGVDAMVIGNHEFDNGTSALVKAYKGSGGFPFLAANYLFDWNNHKGLMDITSPFVILNRGQIKIGIVGMGNDSSLNSIYVIGGSLGFNAIDSVEAATRYVSVIRPFVDIVVLLSHQGLDSDYHLAEKVPGVDIVMGGHHHVVLDPVKVIEGPDERDVLVVHSGVNFKVIGELEIAVKNKKIVWYDYKTHPVTEKVEEDGKMLNLLKPYKEGLDYSQDLNAILGRATKTIKRIDTSGGDSPLGNLVTDAMMVNELSRSQFVVTNSMGIRADIPSGDITREKLYEVFPFENTIVTMYMSGKDVKALFDYVARRSATRGCRTQVQVAGISVELDCSPDEEIQKREGSFALTKCLKIGENIIVDDYELVQPHLIFKMATNDYMGKGGSGFYMLGLNTTMLDTSVSLRDSFAEFLMEKGVIDPDDYSLNQSGQNECGKGKRIRMIN